MTTSSVEKFASTLVEGNDQDDRKYRTDFPFDVSHSPFAKYSANTRLDFKTAISNPRSILISGFADDSIKDGFYELVMNNQHTHDHDYNSTTQTDNINCKMLTKTESSQFPLQFNSFLLHYGKANASLTKIGFDFGTYSHSFITQDSKYIITFENTFGYNVYDINNDSWLLKNNSNCYNIGYNNSDGSRSLLIDDKIIVLSYSDSVDFYYLKTLINPIKIGSCTLKTKQERYSPFGNIIDATMTFSRHGICLTKYSKSKSKSKSTNIDININNNNNNINENDNDKCCNFLYKFDLVLFGGYQNKSFGASFLNLNIILDTKKMIQRERKAESKSKSKRKLIDEKDYLQINEEIINYSTKSFVMWRRGLSSMGFESFKNSRNETIVMILGGQGLSQTYQKCLVLVNTVTWEITRIQNVCKLHVLIVFNFLTLSITE